MIPDCTLPPRPSELNPDHTLQEAGFSAREKLIVSVDDERAEKLRAEHFANLDPVAADSKVVPGLEAGAEWDPYVPEEVGGRRSERVHR